MNEPNTSSPSPSIVQITGSGVTANVHSIAEAKIAIKELKLKKKEYSLLKKNLINQQKQLRAEYNHEVRTRGRIVRGIGIEGLFAQEAERTTREARKVKLANDLAPLEEKKQDIDAMLSGIANTILLLETYILKHRPTGNE
jgi:hypothetical protein